MHTSPSPKPCSPHPAASSTPSGREGQGIHTLAAANQPGGLARGHVPQPDPVPAPSFGNSPVARVRPFGESARPALARTAVRRKFAGGSRGSGVLPQ